MVLDARLSRLAPGLSSRQAVLAYARKHSLADEGNDAHAPMNDIDLAHAEEFEATLEAMFLLAAVDGDISTEEVTQLAGSLEAAMPPSKSLDLDAKLADLNEKLDRDGWKARLDAVALRLTTHDARVFAFRLAAGVALVDDYVAHAEAAAIDALAAALALSSDESQAILSDVQRTLFEADEAEQAEG